MKTQKNYTTEIILIIICTILLNSSLLAQVRIHPDASRTWNKIIERFENAGYPLDFEGQSIVVTVHEHYTFPKKAAAIAHGKDDDRGIYIKLNRQKWDSMTSSMRTYTLLHEIGHDYFNLSHNDYSRSLMFYALPLGDKVDKLVIDRAFNELLYELGMPKKRRRNNKNKKK
jgi:hypothetical protein